MTAQSKVRAMMSCCTLSQKWTTWHSNYAVRRCAFSHESDRELIKHAGMCNSLK